MLYRNKYKVYKTRFPFLGYTKIDVGCWMILDISDDRYDSHIMQVGTHYKTKMELLADLERYATEVWGY